MTSSEEGLGVYSLFFMVPERKGGWRDNLDVKFLSKCIDIRYFWMETLLHHIIITTGELLTSIDLTEAHFHVSVLLVHRKYFQFCLRDYHFWYKAFPFGLVTASRVTSKVLIISVVHLIHQGIHIHSHLVKPLTKSSARRKALDI